VNSWHDLRYAARMLRKTPGFTAIAVITLALGTGATTAVFSVCDALLWRPAPLPRMDTLAMVLQRNPGVPDGWDAVTPGDLEDIRRGSTAFEGLACWRYGTANLAGPGGEPESVRQSLTSAGFFEVAGVLPAMGRAFEAGEAQPGRERESILSDRLWKRRFGADPGIIGKTVRLDDEDFLVVGVMPANFDFPLATDVWTPGALKPAERVSRSANTLVAVGRLKPGRTIWQAEAELEAVASRLAVAYPDTNRNRRFIVWPALKFLTDPHTARSLKLVLGSVFLVLLIACVNVAGLQLTRGTGRVREIAVRSALGARRGRVIAQLVTESVLLGLMGAACGLLVAQWGISLIKTGMPPEIERFTLGWRDLHLDARALAFALAAALASGILAGLAPAWRCSQPNLAGSLREGGRGSSPGRSRHRVRRLLAGAQIALAVVLLAGAGLMVRGFRSLVDRGAALEPSTLLALRLAIPERKYRQPYHQSAFFRAALERIRALPGVRSAGVVSSLPYAGHPSGREFTIEGRAVERGGVPKAMCQIASPGYFETLRIPLRAGRLLSDSDGAAAPRVAVISERMARRWWQGESPVGRRIHMGGPDSKAPWVTIVGVVGDIVHDPFERQPQSVIYAPFAQEPASSMDIGVRTAGNPMLSAPMVTAAIRAVDAGQPITEVMGMKRLIHNRGVRLNYVAALTGVFGLLALGMSAVGLYGVMAHEVAEQAHEIGVRMALGAPRGNVLAMVLRRGMTTVAAGLAVGLPLAYGFARLAASLIHGLQPADAFVFAGMPLALAAAAALAIYVPALRAMRIDPIIALRSE
jgi:putative ABC transport system permease protein